MNNSTPQRLLVVGPSWVGDMVMAQVLFKILKQQQPELLIDVLAPPWTAPLIERMPEVRQAITLPFSHKELKLVARWRFGKTLRAQQYDQAIILPNSWKSAVIALAANIPQRTGWVGEWRWGVLNDVRRLHKATLPLMIQRFAALGLSANASVPARLPQPKLVVESSQLATVLARYQIKMSAQPILALCPGAEFGPSKRWPSAHYAAVANEKLAQGWAVWLFGSAKDRQITDEIQQATQQRCVNLAGDTSLADAIDLMSVVTAVVTNDSGLMHIAAALGKPLVAVYGSTSPAFTPPLSTQATIVRQPIACSPCFKRECPLQHHQCMTLCRPQKVLDALSAIGE